MATTTKPKQVPPLSIFLTEEEAHSIEAFVDSYATLTKSRMGLNAVKLFMELAQKRGMDPHTMRPKGF